MVADRGLNRDTDSITYLVVVAFLFFWSIWVRLLGCEGDEDHTFVS